MAKRKGDWFTVRVLVKITIGTGLRKFTEYEDRFLLVSAQSAQEAKAKAKRLTIAENNCYKNSDGKWVSWRFFRVVDSLRILDSDLRDGVEVWYRYLRTKDPLKVIKREILIP